MTNKTITLDLSLVQMTVDLLHDLRSGSAVERKLRAALADPVPHAGDWAIDTTAGRPILVYQGCSVIEAEQAYYVLGLLNGTVPASGVDLEVFKAIDELADEAHGNGNSWEEWAKPRADMIKSTIARLQADPVPHSGCSRCERSTVENCDDIGCGFLGAGNGETVPPAGGEPGSITLTPEHAERLINRLGKAQMFKEVTELRAAISQPARPMAGLPERHDLPHRSEFESADQHAGATGEAKAWNAACDAWEPHVIRLQAEVERLKALSVTNIMIDVVPGEDGMGHEVYAKSVLEVEEALGRMGEQVEDLESDKINLQSELTKARELLIPAECPHMIVFDDAERETLMFAGEGARTAALKTWEQISGSWNAHLFVRVERNSRDDRYPSANQSAPADKGQMEAVAWSYCPECGCEELHHEVGEHKQCSNCHQEWFSDIDYSDVVRGNLQKLKASQPAPIAVVPFEMISLPPSLTEHHAFDVLRDELEKVGVQVKEQKP